MINYSPEERLAMRRRAVKYVFPVVIPLFSLMLIGQLIVQFMTVKQLYKATGAITAMQTEIIGHQHHRGGHDTPVYALTITLDSARTFNVENATARTILAETLHKGDRIVIYYPTQLFKILSTGLYNQVNQVEFKGKILWSLDKQKQLNRVVIGFMALTIGLCIAGLRSWKNA